MAAISIANWKEDAIALNRELNKAKKLSKDENMLKILNNMAKILGKYDTKSNNSATSNMNSVKNTPKGNVTTTKTTPITTATPVTTTELKMDSGKNTTELGDGDSKNEEKTNAIANSKNNPKSISRVDKQLDKLVDELNEKVHKPWKKQCGSIENLSKHVHRYSNGQYLKKIVQVK